MEVDLKGSIVTENESFLRTKEITLFSHFFTSKNLTRILGCIHHVCKRTFPLSVVATGFI